MDSSPGSEAGYVRSGQDRWLIVSTGRVLYTDRRLDRLPSEQRDGSPASDVVCVDVRKWAEMSGGEAIRFTAAEPATTKGEHR
jgi:hypothetical protein